MPRPGCNLALGLKKVRVCRRARVGTPEPRRRPCDTKWLQWIKSEWDLWINRGRSLVDWNDGQIDEPLPAEIGSWFALCIPSIPLSVGGKCHLSVLLAGGGSGGVGVGVVVRGRIRAYSPRAPSWLACPLLSITGTMQRAPTAQSSTKHPVHPTYCI